MSVEALEAELSWLDGVLRKQNDDVLASYPYGDRPTRLTLLSQAFGLSLFERCVVILALAPEIDQRYEAVAPTVALALSLFCANAEERALARPAFSHASPLGRWVLVPQAETGRNCPLRVEPRIAAFLLGDDTLDDSLRVPSPVARWLNADAEQRELVWSDEQRTQMEALADDAVVMLDGAAGSGRKSFAWEVCRARGLPLLVCDGPWLSVEQARSALREVRLYGAALYLAGPLQPEVARVIDDVPDLLFVTDPIASSRRRLTISLSVPEERLRRTMWEMYTATETAARLAAFFRFLPGQIAEAAADGTELLAACRRVSSRSLVSFATRVRVRRSWRDLVVPKAQIEQMTEIVAHVRHRSRVYDDWGFQDKVSTGHGIVGLFSGPPGTGKTLAAEVIAGDLGLDLYRIDLASLVSKYIGDTEKNLARVFDDGEMNGGILFFDEADAIFGKRSEVKDAHDRYANIEISYLLQRIEDYPGLVILATNMGRNIDAAFQRRMSFVIDFAVPDAAHRRRIWGSVFPAEAPLRDDVDFDFLSERFALSGGHIRNIAVAAAFHAADNGGVIGMQHVLLSLRREYQKLGKVCDRAELGEYYHLVR